MPRRKVQFRQGAYYHIYNRGADRRSIFLHNENYRYLLRLLDKYLEPLQLTLIAYCLLPNHYHWPVRQESETKAGLLPQRVFNAYAKAFNNATSRSGTLFEDRYDAIVVESDEYLRHLCRYIHANPVRHGIAATPELWPYSDYLEWLERKPRRWTDAAFIKAHSASPERYATSVQSYIAGRAQVPIGLERYLAELDDEKQGAHPSRHVPGTGG